MSAARWVACLRLAWAVVLLAEPRAVLTALASSERSSPRARGVVVVLGARNLMQSFVELGWPRRSVLAMTAGIDALHALSLLALATVRPRARWRRAVLLNVAIALGFCVATTATNLTRERHNQAGSR